MCLLRVGSHTVFSAAIGNMDFGLIPYNFEPDYTDEELLQATEAKESKSTDAS